MHFTKDIPKNENELAAEFIEMITGKNGSYTISINNDMISEIIIHSDVTKVQEKKIKEYFSDFTENEKSNRKGN